MGDTNLVGGIARILENPKQKMLHPNISVTQFRVQFPQIRKTHVLHLTVWGNLARDISDYYKINDYILIEGYISLRDKQTSNGLRSKSKKVELTVLKIYPFLISDDGSGSQT
jgi:single-stranded DNA-binding protein